MSDIEMTCEQARDLAAGYVLGALERAEEAAVRDHLATCGEPHPEFEALGGVVPALIEAEDLEVVEPPARLRDRIMAAAAADLALRTSQPGADVGGAAPVAFPSAAEREARSERTRAEESIRGKRTRAERARASRFDWTLRIAAAIAIVALGAWGLGLRGQLDAAQRFDRAVAAVLDVAAKPGSQAVILAPAEGQRGSGIAAVAADGTTTLAMRDLPATSGGQVYTAWVIVGENAPISVGDFSVDANGIASFTSRPAETPAGALLALTLEPNAGNSAPKGTIVSTGVAPGPTGAAG